MGACLRYMHTLNYDELIFLHFFMMKVLWEGLRVERIEGIWELKFYSEKNPAPSFGYESCAAIVESVFCLK